MLAFLNSKVTPAMVTLLNPTMHINPGDVAKLPFPQDDALLSRAGAIADECCRIAKDDWDSSETSWDFAVSPSLQSRIQGSTAAHSFMAVRVCNQKRFHRMEQLEVENNALFIKAYGLDSEVSPEVPPEEITLSHIDQSEEARRLLSYAIGCMMGRYSLDKPGLIYALSGNQGFDPSQYKTFRADDDGIIPLLETDWGIQDNAANRFEEFVGVAWSKEHLDENLKFIADSLGPNNGEQPRETIRRYFAFGFYKHHLSMYKKRPIYWLFSSGKQRAFQCLVYLHRYHEGTLARMRTEYVIPLLGKMNARLEHLQGPADQKGAGGEIAAASSATLRRKLEKERDTVKKQIAELQEFDAKLRHYADLRIKLDLDDGVKVNYGKFSDPKFGDILADVKAIGGKSEDD
jgi:hypothetical protein